MEESIKLLDFLKEINGKNIEEIKKIINEKNIIKSEITVAGVYIALRTLGDEIQIGEKRENNIQKILFREVMLFYSIIENFTNIEILSDEKTIENLNIYLEMALIELSDKIYLFKKMFEEYIVENRYKVIQELTDTFNSGLPSAEDINSLQNSLNEMFKEESPEKLKVIQDILAYNDPLMKEVKDIIANPQISEGVSDNNGDKGQ